MSYSKLSEAKIKKLDGIPLTLSQVNSIAEMADVIDGDKGWPIAISSFKQSHVIFEDKWIEDAKEVSSVNISKQANGSYWITAVSTAALKDREGETFTIAAIDYDMDMAKEFNEYPEFRVFHTNGLGIGRVSKMSRVGIFAVDEGESYTDPFSISVCEKMLLHNEDGKWRVSRGFRVLEASGICPKCGEDLLIKTKQMQIGFRCPSCKSIQIGSKGSLGDMRFLKTRTFDLTVTDTPAVPWTGVTAYPMDLSNMEVMMNKKELRKRLLNAGLEESAVDERLGQVSEDKLKEFDDIPDAILMKELGLTEKSASSTAEDENVFTLDESVLKEFTKIVNKELTAVIEKALSEKLDGLSIEVDDSATVSKEADILTMLKELTDTVSEISNLVQSMTKSDNARIKELVEETPRNGLRIIRTKAAKPAEEDETEDDGEEETPPAKNGKKMPAWLKPKKEVAEDDYDDDVVIMDADGNRAKSMTELVTGGRD